MDQVEKEKSKNTKKEAKSYAQQIHNIINILNGAFKDFPDPEQGKEELENFIPRLCRVLKNSIALNLNCTILLQTPWKKCSQLSTFLEYTLKTARNHLKLFNLSKLVLKVENTFISQVVYLIKIVDTKIDYQDHRDWLLTVRNKIEQIQEQDKKPAPKPRRVST